MSYNIYFSPEKFGLEQIAFIDFSDGDYCFDYRVAWFHKETGVVYTARDSGCSCPAPFEDYVSLDDLDRYDRNSIKEEMREELRKKWGCHINPSEATEFISSVDRFVSLAELNQELTNDEQSEEGF